jgi:hypothetical protein
MLQSAGQRQLAVSSIALACVQQLKLCVWHSQIGAHVESFPKWAPGEVIGCGIDFEVRCVLSGMPLLCGSALCTVLQRRNLFFTRNGKFLRQSGGGYMLLAQHM